MLDQRLRRRADVVQMLYKFLCLQYTAFWLRTVVLLTPQSYVGDGALNCGPTFWFGLHHPLILKPSCMRFKASFFILEK